MRALLLTGLLLLGVAPAWAAEEPNGCDKFKWPIERERAALTAPGRIKARVGQRTHRAAVDGDHARFTRAR
jgi:hypothetical protein